jgi:hypothetical protein
MDEIFISNPYATNNVAGAEGMVLERVKKVVSILVDSCHLLL